MHTLHRSESVALPRTGAARLTHSRLRRPTPLPTMRSEAGFGAYLRRIAWLFGGR